MTDSPNGGSNLGREFSRLARVVAQLRERCPWTGALTHESLLEYLLEESYEVIEAVESGHTRAEDAQELSGELGDLLFQVLLHARLQEETGSFSISDVVTGLTEKMIRRNPHVFRADGSLQDSTTSDTADIERAWDAVKKTEKHRSTPFEGIPAALPALALAAKTQERARRAGLRVPESVSGLPDFESDEELGDILFETVRRAAERGLDPEAALRRAVRRYAAQGPGTAD
ncbi:MazG nucleotide pyrophosphohydrolase domain-containing protein [Arthrobacter gandavensis]|uniref:MazG nucleotide pyrophosphohydrolase domain-containing protein n=1 Tax=Arthrobacter gandavensis TaxID=169960 RepID=UPI002B26C453|nr:MazG nucleotide pyrophosphohydrolase domain-containing protein [Arthrobacter gandavensis]